MKNKDPKTKSKANHPKGSLHEAETQAKILIHAAAF